MKLITCILLMLISAKECDKNKAQLSDSQSSEMTSERLERTMQDSTKITYRAATRGFYLQIWIQGDSIKYTQDNTLKDITTRQIPKKEKEELLKLLSEFDEKSLPELEVLSKTFQYDAKPMANLEVSKGNEVYETQTFDHGNPPKLIRVIVEKILSIKEIVDKQ